MCMGQLVVIIVAFRTHIKVDLLTNLRVNPKSRSSSRTRLDTPEQQWPPSTRCCAATSQLVLPAPFAAESVYKGAPALRILRQSQVRAPPNQQLQHCTTASIAAWQLCAWHCVPDFPCLKSGMLLVGDHSYLLMRRQRS
jgi:hypothetical protein